MKWQFWRRNSQRSAQVVPEDTWHDTPETFPVEEVFRKSCFNWKPLLLSTIASLVPNFLLARKVVEIASKNAMYLNRYMEEASNNPSIINKLSYHHIPSMPYFLVSVGIDMLLFIFIFTYVKNEDNRRKLQYNRLQTFVDHNGTFAIPALLDILRLRISSTRGNLSNLTDTLAYNLKQLLSEVDSDTKLLLNSKQTDLLQALIDEESIYRNNLGRIQQRTLEVYRLILVPSVINTLSMIGGPNFQNVLGQPARVTKSDRIKYLIQQQMDKIDPDRQNLQDHSTVENTEISHRSESHYSYSKNIIILKYYYFDIKYFQFLFQ